MVLQRRIGGDSGVLPAQLSGSGNTKYDRGRAQALLQRRQLTPLQLADEVDMTETEAFKEFKQGLALLRDNFADKALAHMQKAAQLEKNNPYYMSYLGGVLARSEEKWAEAEKLCDNAVRLKRNQAQLYLNLAEVYATAGRRDDAVETLQAGLKYARRDVRLNLAINRLVQRPAPVFTFLSRRHPLNRQIGRNRHRTLAMLVRSSFKTFH